MGEETKKAALVTIDDKSFLEWLDKGAKLEFIESAYNFGAYLAVKKFTRSQIRNVYQEVKRIQHSKMSSTEKKSTLIMILPKLANMVGKDSTLLEVNMKFWEIMKAIIIKTYGMDTDEIEFESRYKKFCEMFEAILAYHTYHGGPR